MPRDADASDLAAAAAGPAGDGAHMRELRLQRNLKIVVAVLGALMALGLLAVAGRVIVMGSSGAKVGATAASRVSSGTPLDIPLELPKGAHVVSVSLAGNRLAVHHESAFGTGIAIIDTDTGKLIANVRPQEALPGR